MRLILFSLLVFQLLSSCISPKKAAERYQPTIDSLQRLTLRQTDTIDTLRLALERSRGGNDMLLETQDRLQDRLLAQDDEIERLESNFSSTSDEMAREVERLRSQLAGRQRRMDSLFNEQSTTITDYTAGLRAVANTLSDSLEMKLDSNAYEVDERAGEVVLSVQEEVLFRPRSVSYLAKENERVLALIAGVLDGNPLLKLRIEGHTDNTPNALRNTDNWAYAALRASKVADELATTYYVSPNRVMAASQGEYGPSRSNATDEGRRRNRRIDFVFTSNVGNLIRQLDRLVDND